MELMIGIALSTVLMSGIVELLSESVSAYRLQLNQSQMEESGRYARNLLVEHITQAGYQQMPWSGQDNFPALTAESQNGDTYSGDQLGLQRWSARNCYGNENPVRASDGRAEFHLLQARFAVNSSNNLALTCRYGPDESGLQTQINNFGLVENVESMQILYSEDRDNDGIGDSWVTAQDWMRESDILSVKVTLMLSTQQAFDSAAGEQITLLDETLAARSDGHLRKVLTTTAAIRGRRR